MAAAVAAWASTHLPVRVQGSARAWVGLAAALGVVAYLTSLGWAPVRLRPFGGVRQAAPVDVGVEPEQQLLAAAQRLPRLWRQRGRQIIIEPQATYAVSGRVVAEDVYYADALSAVAPLDLTLVWGPFADRRWDGRVTYGHFGRFGTLRVDHPGDIDIAALTRHMSNNHLVPASPRVRAALLSVGIGDQVRLEGELINVSITGGGGAFEANTSLVRDDTGAGACEIMYVRRVVIGDVAF